MEFLIYQLTRVPVISVWYFCLMFYEILYGLPNKIKYTFTVFIGLSYERPYLVLEPNSIMISWFLNLCNLPVHRCKPVDYTCKLVDYTCKPVVYTWKVLNFRFTAHILITVLDTVEVTPFFTNVIHCNPL